jgi:flagellar motor switch protein FliN/FliY
MSITVNKIALPELEPQMGSELLLRDNSLTLLSSFEIDCQVSLGSVRLTISELKQLKEGQSLTLNQKVAEPIDLLLNNHVIARGELMCTDDCFALQITEVASL